ncbi:mitochondrial 2-oxodicarboxylate carrier [Cloeon dipterum]|uniref:mitochondrial 2-oxodicarboxylate carrier n=1 Tax=Cloeon dipterum TaxID=197152 RepID=UPI0032200FF4
MSEPRKVAQQAAMQIAAGGSAGFVEVCLMHPLDLVKTRLQLQTRGASLDPQFYNGVVDCLKKMYRHESFLSYWKGVVPPILAETPKRAVKFFTFEQYKKVFLFGSPTPTPVTFSLAGLSAGITEAILVNPFEVVKVSLQANKGKAPSTWSMTRQIVRENGLWGFNKGMTATIARNGAFNMVYFGFYHSAKNYLPESQDPALEFFRKLLLGFVSGTMASCFNIPFDVAKSRIQGPQPASGIKYRSTVATMRIVVAEEGWRALYKGLVPKVMRLGPGGAVMLLVYEHAYAYLQDRFPL